MSRIPRFTILVILLFAAAAQAQLVINPTTTYTAETSKNTSASSMFTDVYFITKQNATVTNGDAVPRNVSKVNVHTLYDNSTTKIYAEWQAWFCHQTSNELPDGPLNPNTSHPTRGSDGATLNWNGPGSTSDASAGYLKTAAEASGGKFQFAIQIDKGAFGGCGSFSTCTYNA